MIISHIKLFISVSLPHLSVFRYLSLGTRGRRFYIALGQDTLSSLQGDLELGLGGQWHQPWGDNGLEVQAWGDNEYEVQAGRTLVYDEVTNQWSQNNIEQCQPSLDFQSSERRPPVHCPPKASATVPPDLVPGPPTGQTGCPTPGHSTTPCLWCPGTDIEKWTSAANSQK